ncbi:MAG: polysulfide reductase NrfD [candidate division KSB1 bacterium]|nr:polysulfide reductase NrfD [candidate division KSB1 bacterium]
MLEKALKGSPGYFAWLCVLLALIGIGAICYFRQLMYGLGITGMSRDVSWGLYIAQFTFLVGVAASAVMLVLPYYLHDHKIFGRITILGEFLAVAAVSMCLSFIIVDLGQPFRAFNVLLYPTPNSVLFWDMVVLNGYLFLNIFIGWTLISAEKKGTPAPKWIKPFIYISIPWAVSIHTVTAFLYAGLPGRHFWLTAIMAPRFLASAFAAGPALLIIFCYILRRFAGFEAGWEAIKSLSKTVAYAMLISVFFVLCEIFTVFYSQIPEHMNHFVYQWRGLEHHGHLYWKFVPWMWLCGALAIIACVLLVVPKWRNNEAVLPWACAAVFFSLWIEKGITLTMTGFIPSPTETITEYSPTLNEIGVTIGVWALGFFILTILYKVALAVKEISGGEVAH